MTGWPGFPSTPDGTGLKTLNPAPLSRDYPSELMDFQPNQFLCKIERVAAVFRNDSGENGSLSPAGGRRDSMVASHIRRI